MGPVFSRQALFQELCAGELEFSVLLGNAVRHENIEAATVSEGVAKGVSQLMAVLGHFPCFPDHQVHFVHILKNIKLVIRKLVVLEAEFWIIQIIINYVFFCYSET